MKNTAKIYFIILLALGLFSLTLLQKAISTRVVFEKADTYTWNRSAGLITLGERYEDAVAFLMNPSKDTLVAELEAEIKSKLV